MLHISRALSHNAFSLMHESPDYDSTNCCHNLFIFIRLMLASFSLVEILMAVTIKVQTNRKRKFCVASFIKHEIISHSSHAVMVMKKCDTCADLLFC